MQQALPSDTKTDVEPQIVRVTINFPIKAWETLSKVAAEQQVNRTEALRRAVSAYLLLHEAVEDGDKVVLEHKNGSSETVNIRY